MAFDSRRRRWLRLWPESSEEITRAIDDEIRAHLEMRVEALVRAGETPEGARVEALRRFGDLEEGRRRLIVGMQEHKRKRARVERLQGLGREVGYAIRHLRRSPAYSAFAVATFGLGIALTTATFTLVDGVLIRALPFIEPDRLVQLQSVDSAGEPVPWVSRSNWVDWREQNRSLESTALHRRFRVPVLANGEATRVAGEVVVGQFFEVLGSRMLVGRAFTEAEAQALEPVVVVSEGLWRSLLSADPSLSLPLTISGVTRTVVGVVRANDAYPADADLWFPMRYYAQSGIVRNSINWLSIARLRRGVTVEQADRELDSIAQRIHQQDPVAMYSYGVAVRPLKDLVVADAGRYLGLFMGAVTFVLLVACANLASVNVARGAWRERELAVRAALGAGRTRLVRELLVEQSILAFAGGAAGVALAWLGLRVVLSESGVLSDPAGVALPRSHEVAIDARVLGFALAVSMLAALLSGALPALQVTRSSLRGQLAGARGQVRGGRNLPGAILVGLEAALALVLLTGGGLLLRSYRALHARDVGFQTRDVVAAEISFAATRFENDPGGLVQYWEDLIASLGSVPGVAAVGLANWVPLSIEGTTFIEIEGRGETRDAAAYRAVSDDYFQALNIPLFVGRTFDSSDRRGSLRVVVVNQRMAETFWPGESPIGERMRATSMEPDSGGAPWLSVVGVVGDIRHWGLEDDVNPEMYVLYRQVPGRTSTMTAVARTSLPAARVMGAIRDRLRAHDPWTPADLSTFDERLADSLRRRQFTMSLLTGFAALALLLAAMGVYGLLSFAVSRRAREIAVRAALGARRSDLIRMVLRNAMLVLGAATGAGLLVALALSRLLSAMLVEVSPADPFTFATGAAFLLATGFLAALKPATRAARTDPAIVLQSE